MSFTSYSFKDNIVISDSKWIRWLNSSGTTRANILGVDSNNVYLNSGAESLYINNNNNSYTFINNSNSNNVLIGSKMSIGINTTTNLNANLAIASTGYIGTNVKNGYIGLSGTYSSSHTDGSLIRLYGNNSSNYGQIHIVSGNHSSGHLNFYTNDNSLKMQIMNSGMVNISPNGSDIRLSVADNITTITNVTKITNTTQSTDTSTGALQVSGGMSIAKTLYVGESIITGNVQYGTISYGNLYADIFNIGVTKTLSSTFLAANNVSSPTNITGLIFDSNNIRSFQATISVAIIRSSGGNLYENISVEGHYTETNGWVIYTSNIGDVSGINLSITSMGQLRYTSSNITNWNSTSLRYVVTYISNTNNYEGINITSGTFNVNTLQINDSTNAIFNSQNGSFYSFGGGTFDKDLVIKGSIIFANATGTNIIATNITTGTLQASTGITSPIAQLTNANITTSTIGTLQNTNLISTNITTTTLRTTNDISTNITTATLQASTGITSASALITNINSTNITTTTLRTTNEISTNITTTTLRTTNDISTNITTATLNVTTGITSATALLTNVNSTNITASTLRITGGGLVATFNSNTIGSLYTTSGNIGIGMTSPAYTVDVNGNINVSGDLYKNGVVYSLGGSSQWTTLGSDIFYTGGNVGIGTTSPFYKLHVDGDIYAVGKVVAFSDERLKTDINSIDNALNKVTNLRGVEYKMLNTDEKHIGVIAQEVEDICPELVVSKADYKGVCYGNMVGLLIEAIKELNEKIKKLEQK